jgi:hypothetical protein
MTARTAATRADAQAYPDVDMAGMRDQRMTATNKGKPRLAEVIEDILATLDQVAFAPEIALFVPRVSGFG